MSLPVLAALCDLLEVTPPTSSPPAPKETPPARPPALAGPTAVAGRAELRQTRAQLRPER
ncbi:hypothetical protein [Pseudonocardia sp. MH-G8]|uniref:hypothetical protein n=1 Tax=Pseudonocardia sp. MH-G8 TaxID=1854588 RepID=UPI001E29C6C4|nr:hypothetical protein [Pseudonocardia sp. MH-G8]